MAHLLHCKVTESLSQPLVGRQLFDVITAGMYDNPLMIYREYVQNAVDAIDLAVARKLLTYEQAQVNITIDRRGRSIIVEDNGAGLSNSEAFRTLVSLGCSPKEDTEQRGFRGIGRLGGLAYSGRLVFETRSSAHEPVAVVLWDRAQFEALAGEKRRVSLEETLDRVSSCEFRPAHQNDPPHFFRATLYEVLDFHNDEIMSPKKVADYLAHVAPVPFAQEGFSFGRELEDWLRPIKNYHCYPIKLNGEPVVRPYRDEILQSSQCSDNIRSIKPIEFYCEDGQLLARGWYAETGYLAALPETCNIRGIRIRVGNIEVGDQHSLTRYFSEARFSGWHLGEIHIADQRLKPNARRDGFEQNATLERFIEQASPLCRFLSGLCRKSSTHRVKKERLVRSIEKLEKFHPQSVIFIDSEHYRRTMGKARNDLELIEKTLHIFRGESELVNRFEALQGRYKQEFTPEFLADYYDGRSIGEGIIGQKVAKTLAQVANLMLEEFDQCNSANELLDRVLSKYMVGRKKGAVKIASI